MNAALSSGAVTLEGTRHQIAVVAFLREFLPNGWSLPLSKQHDGSHAVLSRMAEEGLLMIDKRPGVWTYEVANDV